MKPQLKEINGRYYQEAEVVMLANKDYHSDIEFDDTLQLVRHKGYANKNGQHLYILSDEEIKEGDWVLHLDSKTIIKYDLDEEANNSYKKIIATTDNSINVYTKGDYDFNEITGGTNYYHIPKPSDSFIKKYIEEYNKGNIITNVLIEYKDQGYYDAIDEDKTWIEDWQLKVDSNNNITIKRVEPKLYTREEIEILITNAFKAGYERSHSGYPHTDNWSKPKVEEFLKENL